MAETVHWGVLGNATIARKSVIPAIQTSGNGQVLALATRTPAAAEEVVSRNHIEHVYDRYDALLANPDIDAVYIPLPNHLHHPWTLSALAAGKHVLCEKPLARNAAEAQEMARAAEQAGLLLMEAFMYRFHPRSQRIHQMTADGSIGKPRIVRSAFCYHMPENILQSSGNARLNPELGGGALLDVGCYSVSAARWLFGQEPRQVQAQAIYHASGADVHFAGILRFPGSALATFEASFISALQQTFTAVGSQAAIELPHNAFIPFENDAVYTMRRRDQETGREYVVPGADEYQLMVEHFADVVLGRQKLTYTPEDSIQNMRVLDALAEAARCGQTISL